MTDTTAATTAAATTAATTAAAATAATTAPWHAGVDADTVGHWQNKAYDMSDPVKVALAATKQARELEKHFGVPAEQLLKLPKATAPEAEFKAFYQKLGAPADPKEYDFTTLKFNGEPLDASFQDAMRSSLAAAFVPKDKAVAVTAGVVKFLEDAEKAEAAVTASKIAEEQTKLKVDWGTNYDFNRLKAMEGARRLGITPEAVQAMENQVGYAAVMQAMRKIGMATSEDTFVERGAAGGPGQGVGVTTREGAMSRKAELMKDAAWGARYVAGDSQAKIEMTMLNQMIDGAA